MSVYQFAPPPDLATNEQNFATWEGGFSDAEIADIISYGNEMPIARATVNKDKNDPRVRKSTTGWIGCTPTAQFIYDRLGYIARMLNGQFFEFDLYGFVEDFQYTVYRSDNDHYDWHMDKGNTSASPRKLSMVLQLSDPEDYMGGDLQLMLGSEIITAEKKKGMIYAFPSYILHRVTPVSEGTRKSLVVWVAGPKFR